MSASEMLKRCGLTADDVRRLTEPYKVGSADSPIGTRSYRGYRRFKDDGTPPKGPWGGFKPGCSMVHDTRIYADLLYHGGACYEPPEV